MQRQLQSQLDRQREMQQTMRQEAHQRIETQRTEMRSACQLEAAQVQGALNARYEAAEAATRRKEVDALNRYEVRLSETSDASARASVTTLMTRARRSEEETLQRYRDDAFAEECHALYRLRLALDSSEQKVQEHERTIQNGNFRCEQLMFQSESTIRSLEDLERMRLRECTPASSSNSDVDLRIREVELREAAAVQRALEESTAHEQSLFLKESEIAKYDEAERLASNQHRRQLMELKASPTTGAGRCKS